MSDTASKDKEAYLWDAYWQSGCDDLCRDQLLTHYRLFARSITLSLFSRFRRSEAEFEDLYQEAQIGLLEAVQRFKPDQGASFKTFASYRIRGAVLDAIERTSENLGQAAHQRRLQAERMQSALNSAGAKHSSLLEQVIDVTLEVALGYVIEKESSGNAEPVSPVPYGESDARLIGYKLEHYLKHLSVTESQIIRYHYLEGMEFKEIASALELSKARVSQLHSRGLSKLRERILLRRQSAEGD